jgi:hypothetical protein
LLLLCIILETRNRNLVGHPSISRLCIFNQVFFFFFFFATRPQTR